MDKNTKLGLSFGTFLALLTGQFMFAYADSLTRQLEMGMSGSDVGMLQQFLASDPTVYPKGKVTNYFGELTKNAVHKFQEKNNLPSVGRVGPQTMNMINSMMGNSVSATSTTSVNTNMNTGGGGNINRVGVNTLNSMITVNWSTPVPSRGMVHYNTQPLTMSENDNSVDISGMEISEQNFTTEHSLQIPNLQMGQDYYFSIHSTDQDGNVNMTWPAMFRAQ